MVCAIGENQVCDAGPLPRSALAVAAYLARRLGGVSRRGRLRVARRQLLARPLWTVRGAR